MPIPPTSARETERQGGLSEWGSRRVRTELTSRRRGDSRCFAVVAQPEHALLPGAAGAGAARPGLWPLRANANHCFQEYNFRILTGTVEKAVDGTICDPHKIGPATSVPRDIDACEDS